MATATPLPKPKRTDRAGLSYWMRRVLKQCDRVQHEFDMDAVHDLRVALRRCRSMADTLREVDPDPAWRKMRKASRKLFRALGELRDSQVMGGWLKTLAPESDLVANRMLGILAEREGAGRAKAERALGRLDRKRWADWSSKLPERIRCIPRADAVFQHLALERWEEAHELHQRAMRSRSRIAYHRLRIGIKHFRYTIENFLPRHHAQWSADLKSLQDLLGEVHDLDVLRIALPRTGEVFDAEARARWQVWIENARKARLHQYHAKMAGKESLWPVWRARLPLGTRIEAASFARLSAWGAFLDPDFAHAQHVTRLALELFDGLRTLVPGELLHNDRATKILRAAALLHDVGRAEGDRGHHKGSYRMIRDLRPPLGWTDQEMRCVALVARYHRGAEPRETHPGYATLSPTEQRTVKWLAGTVRFADGLDQSHDGRVPKLWVESTQQTIAVRARGYTHDLLSAVYLEGKKHLLESVCGIPIVVRPEKVSEAISLPASAAS